MKVTAFNGSPRENGNTALLLRTVTDVLNEHDIETEIVQVGGERLRGCAACMNCKKNRDGHCAFTDDPMNTYIDRMRESDGIIIGSPTYFSNVTAETKALIDRAGYVSLANGRMLERKVGAAVVAVRRAGSIAVFDAINKLFLINKMIVPGSIYWNLGIGREEGEVKQDEEGLRTMRELGEQMAWLLPRLRD
ncbi:flavodoxin family protein [bacterium]|nr:flavodoxin family protein [bacterium]